MTERPRTTRLRESIQGLTLRELHTLKDDIAAAITQRETMTPTELRGTGRTRRGLPADFLDIIEQEHNELIADNHPKPGRELAARHSVNSSTVSRWLKQIRSRT